MNSIELARKIRIDGIKMTNVSHGSHIGAVLSIADILAVLYSDILKYNIKNPTYEKRDRVILSKGHAGAAIYAVLAESGFFPVEELLTHYSNGSRLSGHVSHKNVPGVEFSTGSLGHGLSVGAGLSVAMKKENKNNRIFVICGDGECDEGSMWEAALFANQFNLNNLTLIIDHNKLQGLDFCDKVIDLLSLKNKFEAFGWRVVEIDGHNHDELRKSLKLIDESKPLCIVANTIKGKGVSFMENQVLWHYRDPQGELYDQAIRELGGDK